MKKKRINEKKIMMFMVIGLVCLIIGIFIGQVMAMVSIAEIVSHIQIGDININETRMINALMAYMNDTGMLEQVMVENG